MRLLRVRLCVVTGACRAGSLASRSGVALVSALLAMALALVIGGAVVLLAMAETRLLGIERGRVAARAVAQVQLERAFQDLARAADWSAVLSGAMPSTFVGAEARPRVPGWGVVDLPGLTARLGAGGASRWGADAPRWRLYAHGWSSDLLAGSVVGGPFYSAVWVADDEVDGDGRPEVDRNGVIGVRAEAFGPNGVRQVWVATVRRVGDGVELVSLRVPP